MLLNWKTAGLSKCDVRLKLTALIYQTLQNGDKCLQLAAIIVTKHIISQAYCYIINRSDLGHLAVAVTELYKRESAFDSQPV